jgi:hypothetical protein
MSPNTGKQVLKPGTSSVFVGQGSARAPISWRLDVREDGRGKQALFGNGKSRVIGRGRPKLFHYISAGGMRQLRRTSADDLVEDRRRSFLCFLGLAVAVWVFFYFLPCA